MIEMRVGRRMDIYISKVKKERERGRMVVVASG